MRVLPTLAARHFGVTGGPTLVSLIPRENDVLMRTCNGDGPVQDMKHAGIHQATGNSWFLEIGSLDYSCDQQLIVFQGISVT